MRSGHHPLLLTILFRNALCVRPNLNDERLVSTLGGDGNHVSNVNVTCPTAIPSETSRFDFELTPEKVGAWVRGYNAQSNYSLHRTAECNSLIDVPVTVFLMMDAENPFESKVSIILGDEVMLQPDLQTQPMYVCGRPSLYENTDAQSQRAKVVVALQCFCQLNLRPLRHQKPLRRQFLEVSWETWNSLVPERCIMAVIWFLESKLSPQSSGSVTNQTKSVSISGARLKMLLQLEDVDSTYGRFCPNVLAVFDICYLVMLLIMLILSVSLAIVVSRKLPDTWRLEDADVTKTFKIDDPVQLCRAWGLQMGAFVGFILALQGVAIRFIIDPKLLPFIIGFTMLVGLLGLFQMMNTFCRAQLANAALAHGLQVCWGSGKGRFSVLIANASFAPAVAASCCFILIGAASNNLGLMVTAGIVMIPAVLGIAKAVVFLLEKEMGLQRNLVPAFVSEVFASAENVSSQKAQVPSHKRGSLRRLSGQAFLNCCRYDENPHTKSTEDLDVADDDSDDETFQWIRDLPWHGRAIWRLAGTRVAWLNPLLLAMLTLVILGISSARFAIIVCTPPALLDFQPATGQLVPQFRKGRRHYGWYRDLTLKQGMEVFSFSKISRVELNDSLNSGVNVGFWDRSRKGCITTCTVQSDQLGLVQKTYTVADVPVHLVPVTIRLRFGNFDRCLWFSMLKSTDHGFVPISVPRDVGSGMVNVSVSVSFRQITSEKPVRSEQRDENVPFGTVCRSKSQTLALGSATCDEACAQEPRCLVANELKSHCCFMWIPSLQSEEVCKVENAEVPLVQRLLPGRSVEGTTLQGSAHILRLGEAHKEDKSSADRSTIEWTFNLTSSNFGDYDLHLNQLGAEAMQNFGASLTLSMGAPKMQGAMAVLEANEQEDVVVSVESDPEQNQIIHLWPNENFSFSKSGFSRKLHVVPLLADHSLSYKLLCKKKLKSDECQALAEEEKLKLLFRKKCLSNQALGRWYDVCGGPFPARVATVEVNLLYSSTLAASVELKPTEERFNSSMGKITVRPHFMSEELRVKLLQKDSKNHSCRVRGTMEELAPTPFACAIFEAKCKYLIFLDSENDVISKLRVLSRTKSSVLSRLKARLNNIEFATVALCAVEHPKFKPSMGMRINVNIKDLLRASEAGAKVGPHAWRLIIGSLQSDSWSDSVLDSLLAAIRGNTADDMLGAVAKGIFNRFGEDLCSKVGGGKDLTNTAMMMMNVGDTYSAERFLTLLQQHNQKKYLCLCSNILSRYIEEGDPGMCGKSLQKLSALTVFQPTRARIAAHKLLSENSRKRLAYVLPSLPTVRFVDVVDAVGDSLIYAMVFLAGCLPPAVKVVSLRANLSADNSMIYDTFLPAMSFERGEVRLCLERLVLPAPSVESNFELAGLFDLIAAFWLAQIGHLDLRDWVFHPEFNLDLMKFDHLEPHQTIKDLTFNCTLRGGNDDECDCRPDLLVDLVARLPLLQRLIYSLNSGLHPLQEPVQNSSCLGHDGLERLARSLSEHKNLTHLILKGHAYEVLPMISNQSIDKFKEIHVEISSKLLQDAEVKSVMEREKQRFGPTLRIEARRIKAT